MEGYLTQQTEVECEHCIDTRIQVRVDTDYIDTRIHVRGDTEYIDTRIQVRGGVQST